MLEASPQAFAQALLTSLNAKPPIDVEAVAQALHLNIRHVNSRAYDGAMFPFRKRAGGIVTVSGNADRGRRRFTLAHEIGHYVLPSKTSAAACSIRSAGTWGHKNTRGERDADAFAVELLLPSHEVRSLVSGQGLPTSTVQQIREVFDVSLTAAAYRAVEFVEHECAVVVTIDGVVKHYHPSRTWRHRIRTNCAVGKYTAAGHLFDGRRDREHCDTVYLSEWVRNADRAAKVWEEALYQMTYSTIISLLSVLDDDDPNEDYSDVNVGEAYPVERILDSYDYHSDS